MSAAVNALHCPPLKWWTSADQKLGVRLWVAQVLLSESELLGWLKIQWLHYQHSPSKADSLSPLYRGEESAEMAAAASTVERTTWRLFVALECTGCTWCCWDTQMNTQLPKHRWAVICRMVELDWHRLTEANTSTKSLIRRCASLRRESARFSWLCATATAVPTVCRWSAKG